MCGIVASTDLQTFIELMEHNTRRGNKKHSIAVGDDVFQFDCPFEAERFRRDVEKLGIGDGSYFIGHVHAPTGSVVEYQNQPAMLNGMKLFHNGIMKDKFMRKHRELSEWDTLVMLRLLDERGFEALDDFEGSFACIMSKDAKWFAFRNQIAPLFINLDNGLHLSSERVEGWDQIDPCTIYELDFMKRTTSIVGKFDNKELPYYFG